MPSGVLRVNARPAKIKLRIKSSGAPASANVEITDVMFQPGASVSGWLPHVTEMPWVSGVTDMDSGGGSVVIRWEDVEGKPISYPPANHTHRISDVEGLQDALDSAGGGSALEIDRSSGTQVTLPDAGGNVVIMSNTGVRDITAEWDEGIGVGVQAAQALIYRSGESVTLMLQIMPAGSGDVKIAYTLPPGFLPSTLAIMTPSAFTRGDLVGAVVAIQTGVVLAAYETMGSWAEGTPEENKTVSGQLTWHTADPWPTALPGVAI